MRPPSGSLRPPSPGGRLLLGVSVSPLRRTCRPRASPTYESRILDAPGPRPAHRHDVMAWRWVPEPVHWDEAGCQCRLLNPARISAVMTCRPPVTANPYTAVQTLCSTPAAAPRPPVLRCPQLIPLHCRGDQFALHRSGSTAPQPLRLERPVRRWQADCRTRRVAHPGLHALRPMDGRQHHPLAAPCDPMGSAGDH